jgi:flagellar biosynthesis/type III secretory pathway chaperone
MRKIVLSVLAVALTAGCVSKKKFDDLVLEQQRVSTQKDSLVAEVLAATQMVTEINADLAKVKALGVSPVSSGDAPLSGRAEERQILLGKIREVIARLDAAEKSVSDQKKSIGNLTAERKKLMAQLDAFQQTISDLRSAAEQQESLITSQREQIQTLASRVDTLTQQTSDLTMVNAAVRDTLTHAIDDANVVYYAVGTKDELLKRGIVVNEGSKFLIFGGKTLMPAREFHPELYQQLDLRRDTVLTVPEPNREYKIVTRQSPDFLSSTVTKDGKIKGDLHISSPSFWDGGKYLILVRN